MSRHSPRRGHRRHARTERPLGWLVAGSFAILGLALLAVLHFTPGPVALALLLVLIAVPVLVAFAVVSCATGRAAAWLTNFVRLCAGYAGLEKLAHESHVARSTREAGPREAA